MRRRGTRLGRCAVILGVLAGPLLLASATVSTVSAATCTWHTSDVRWQHDYVSPSLRADNGFHFGVCVTPTHGGQVGMQSNTFTQSVYSGINNPFHKADASLGANITSTRLADGTLRVTANGYTYETTFGLE